MRLFLTDESFSKYLPCEDLNQTEKESKQIRSYTGEVVLKCSLSHGLAQLFKACIVMSKETCLRGVANNKGAEQPAHPRSLIRAFVIRFLESIICELGTGDISIF